MQRLSPLLPILLLAFGCVTPTRAEVTDAQVTAHIEILQRQLLRSQQSDGLWFNPQYPVGLTALVVQALLRSGLKPDHPELARAIAHLADNTDEKVYSEGLVPPALAMADGRKYRRRISEAVNFLRMSQLAGGNWTYGIRQGGGGDNSNTQFAVLGLAAAMDAGVAIPEQTRQAAIDHWSRTQNADGGWGYTVNGGSTMSMTCAGIASLNMLGLKLATKQDCCGEYTYRRELVNGLRWLGQALVRDPREVFGASNQPLYTLYALERVGIALGVKEISGVDWYRWGADAIVSHNIGGRNTVDQAFALLFLSRGSAPIALAKWRWQGDWNNQYDDARNWTIHAGEELGLELDFVESRLNRMDSPAAKASLIYLNGSKPFKMTDDELDFLRAFLDNDGTLVAEPTCDGTAFYDSFRKEILVRLCPEYGSNFVPLDIDHPVLTAKYQLIPEEVGALQFQAGCKQYRIILLTRGISCALNGDVNSRADLPRARKVATNLLAWAMEAKGAERKLDELTLLPETRNEVLTLDQIERRATRSGRRFHQPTGRLRHRGQWLAAPGFLATLRTSLESEPNLPRFDGEMYLNATDEDLFHAAVLFMSGYDYPTLPEADIVSLRGYLQNGGFLLATSACSNDSFDKGFREIVRKLLPNDNLEPIPPEDPLWKSAYPLLQGAPTTTRAYQTKYDQRWAPLYGIRREGRWILVYSPVDFCSDMVDPLGEAVIGYRRESAFKLIANILRQAFTP